MTRYEQGFLRKCAAYGVDGRPILQKIAQAASASTPPPAAADKKPSWFGRQYEAAKDWGKKNPEGVGAIGGAATGAAAMALYEALRKRRDENDRKDYLKKILIGLVAGGGIGAVGGHYAPKAYDAAKPAAQASWDWMKDVGNAFAGQGKRTAPRVEAARAKRKAHNEAKKAKKNNGGN